MSRFGMREPEVGEYIVEMRGYNDGLWYQETSPVAELEIAKNTITSLQKLYHRVPHRIVQVVHFDGGSADRRK